MSTFSQGLTLLLIGAKLFGVSLSWWWVPVPFVVELVGLLLLEWAGSTNLKDDLEDIRKTHEERRRKAGADAFESREEWMKREGKAK